MDLQGGDERVFWEVFFNGFCFLSLSKLLKIWDKVTVLTNIYKTRAKATVITDIRRNFARFTLITYQKIKEF